jgi:hypothetical protein
MIPGYKENLAKIGLELADKCVMYVKSGSEFPTNCPFRCSRDLNCLGTPLGDDEYVLDQLNQYATHEVEEPIQLLKAMANTCTDSRENDAVEEHLQTCDRNASSYALSLQELLLLLRHCLSPQAKVGHLLATVPPELSMRGLSKVDDTVRDIVDYIVGSNVEDYSFLRAQLPLSYAGLGLLGVQLGAEYRYSAMLDALKEDWHDFALPGSDCVIDPDHALNKTAAERVKQSLKEDPAYRPLLKSIYALKEDEYRLSTAWLRASGNIVLSDSDVRTSVGTLLAVDPLAFLKKHSEDLRRYSSTKSGIPQVDPKFKIYCPACKKMQHSVAHHLGCIGVGLSRIRESRHDKVVAFLADAALKRKMNPRREVTYLPLPAATGELQNTTPLPPQPINNEESASEEEQANRAVPRGHATYRSRHQGLRTDLDVIHRGGELHTDVYIGIKNLADAVKLKTDTYVPRVCSADAFYPVVMTALGLCHTRAIEFLHGVLGLSGYEKIRLSCILMKANAAMTQLWRSRVIDFCRVMDPRTRPRHAGRRRRNENNENNMNVNGIQDMLGVDVHGTPLEI